MKIFTTDDINNILVKYNKSEKTTRKDKIWFQNIEGVRKSGMCFSLSHKELHEYAKCYNSVQYFAENYIKIINDYGKIRTIELRDYQKEILEEELNRFSIILKSRQVGINVTMCILFLHKMLFEDDKKILIVANKFQTASEILSKLKDIYLLLPFYLKQGVLVWNKKSLIFENGSRIETAIRTKELQIEDYDIFYIDEFSKIPQFIIEPFYMNLINKMKKESRLIISSVPNGFNLFYDLVQCSELPLNHPNKNLFVTKRIYWWQVQGRMDTKMNILNDKIKQYGIDEEVIINHLKNQGIVVYDKCIDGKMWYFLKYDSNNENSMIWKIRQMKINNVPLVELAEITNWKEEMIRLLGSEYIFRTEYDLCFQF